MTAWSRGCRWLSTAVMVLSLVGATLLAGIFVAPTTAHAAPPGAAVTDFGACLASQQRGDVLLMIDESSSLQSSDPNAARVTSANFLVDQLSRFSKSAGVALNVAVSGFADKYAVTQDWTPLDAGSVASILSSIDGFRTRSRGIDTDYWLALDGARKTLASRGASTDGVRPCQAVAWFSDGKIDFTPRSGVDKPYAPGVSLDSQAGVDKVASAATQSICRPGGVADQLRSSGVVVFAIGLAAGDASPKDFDVMRSIATGEPSGPTACGKVTSPSPGDFYLAQNIDDLLFAFDAFSTPGQPPLTRESGVCAITVCEEGKHRFVLDRSVGSVSVLGSADADGLIPTLVSPSGKQVPLPNNGKQQQASAGGVDITYRWESPRTVSFDMVNANAPDWQGAWALVFVDPTGSASRARSKSNIHISGNLFPAWKGQKNTVIHSGESSVPVNLSIVDSDRKNIDPKSLLGKASLTVQLTGADGRTRTVASDVTKDRIGETIDLNLTSVPPGQATLRLTLKVTTADATTPDGSTEPGTELAPQSVDVPLSVAPPIGFPSVATKLDFGTVEGGGVFKGSLGVTGPGCVWLPRASSSVVASPDRAGDITVESDLATSEGCVELGDGQTGSIPVSLNVPNSVNGVVNGTVAVMVSPKGEADRAVSVEVPYTAALEKPLDTRNFILALIVALILGPGIPLLLLYGSKWYTARIPSRTLKAQQFPISVSGSSVLRDGRPFVLTDRDLIEVVRGLESPARRLDVAGITLRTKIGLSPVGAGFVVAESPGRVGASGSSPSTHGKEPYARLPLAVHNTWFVIHDSAGPADQATVVLLVGDDAGPSRRTSLVDDMVRRLPELLSELRSRAAPRPGSPPPSPPPNSDPFGGPSGYGPPPSTSPSESTPSDNDPFGFGSSR